MESGTSNGLYIIVAIVIMSIFLIITTSMGVSVNGMITDMVSVVEDGNEFVLEEVKPAPPTIVHNIEPPYEGFEGVYVAFFDNPRLQELGVTDDRHGFNEAIYAAGVETGGTDKIYVEYAVFDKKGNVTERFVYGDKNTATHIAINDERLLPKGSEYSTIGGGYAIGTGSVRYLQLEKGPDNGKMYIMGTDEGVDTADRVHANK